jgi:hypothetical protein
VSDRLTVVEEPDRFLVVREEDPADWLCAFAKTADFPAERWARDMARTYNARLQLMSTSSRRPPAASGP